nr:MAG TPA: hypothetical protein [Caudoviricetes sp.]
MKKECQTSTLFLWRRTDFATFASVLHRGVEQWQLVGFIPQRLQVRVLPPQHHRISFCHIVDF